MTEFLEEEAKAFDQRISQRVEHGFIPDLRRAVKCDYFYKSFWRDPQFIKLFVGSICDGYLSLLHEHCGSGLRILDVGCGSGYISLELARHGHHVHAIDISSKSIEIARKVLAENPFKDGFGSLHYENKAFFDVLGKYDVILFSVSMHHMSDLDKVTGHAASLLLDGGHLLCYEPCHERFQLKDAAIVSLIRILLSLTGHWYEPDETRDACLSEAQLDAYVNDIHTEYFLERDKNEPGGQSPNDLESNGEEILRAVRSRFTQIDYRPGISFIYRLLGGLRGQDETVEKIADFLALYDRFSVSRGYINENGFYFLGKK